MGLRKYRDKRDFVRTPEPEGEVSASTSGRLYIVQKHAASHLHYDLRLELDGVLKSWAVPKGPSLDPAEKRLAVHVEDHPIEYGSFEGVIPAGEYGGGTVMLWDRGTWEPEGDPHKGYQSGNFKFRLFGEKLKGSWVLARMKGDRSGEGKNWLLIKKRDESSITPPQADPVNTLNRSVSSDRSMDEIAENREKVWFEGASVPGVDVPPEPGQQAGKIRRSNTPNKTDRPRIDPSTVAGARRAAQPELFTPELATLVTVPPRGENWIHEIKYDGYRILCILSGGQARLVSRNGNDWTSKFAGIAESASRLGIPNAILDGEIVVVDSEGRTDFQALQNILKGLGAGGQLAYFVFDLPHFMGYDLTEAPLIERKNLLRQLLRESFPQDVNSIKYTDHIQGHGETVYMQACRLALEGVVSKQADSPYERRRSRRWVKVKCSRRQEFVIGGYSDPGGSRTGFGALLLGYHDTSGRLVFSGKVGTGFNEKMLNEITPQLTAIEIDIPPFINPPTGYEAKGVHWVRPEMVAEVEFTAWTDEGILRHPSFKGLREDKNPEEIVREQPVPREFDSIPDETGAMHETESPSMAEDPTQPGKTENRRKRSTSSGKKHVTGSEGSSPVGKKEIRIRKSPSAEKKKRIPMSRKSNADPTFSLSNPDRVLYPEIELTKRALAEYYKDVARWILPHLTRRPLTLVRCPEGREHECFYQKHLGDMAPAPLRPVPITEKNGQEYYSVLESPEGLTALVQIGVLEIHVWGSRDDKLEQPDMMIFDLDPDPEVSWTRIVEASYLMRDRLESLGLRSFVKTTGGKGLHVVVPLTPRVEWDGVKEFSKALAESIVKEAPREYIATMSKAKRKGKIFIDYLRNGRGATSICAFSTRRRPGAPISTPVAWEELTTDLRPDSYTIGNIRDRLSSLQKDPWEDYFSVRQSITAKMRKQLGLTDSSK